MSHQVLARKWRPKAFAEVVGQDHVVRALANALETRRIHHAYLFTGTRGVGKTTLARILAKALNCVGPDGAGDITSTPCGVCAACTGIDSGRFVDVLEVDAATNTKVEEMRELLESARYQPVAGRYKVYIIDEVHMLSKPAFNSMLKTLEEPPAHVQFILATTDPQKLPVTVLSRCLQFNLKQLPAALIASHLHRVLQAENVAGEVAALKLIGRAAEGSVRDSLSLLDQAIAHGAGKVELAAVASMLGTLDQSYVFGLLECLAIGDAAGVLQQIATLSERSVSFDLALRDLADLLQRVAFCQASPGYASSDGDDARVRELAQALSAESLQLYYQIAILGRRDLPLAPDETAGVSMTLLRMLALGGAGPRPKVLSMKPAQAAEAARGTKEESQTAQGFDGNWLALVKHLDLGSMAGMLAKQCVLVSYESNALQLSVSSENQHLAEKSYVEKLRQALQVHFPAGLRLSVVVKGASGATLASAEQAAAQARQTAAEAAMHKDAFVQAMVHDFGVDLARTTIKPIHG